MKTIGRANIYPDFIVTARDADGKEVMWLVETKGEVRPNTKLKSRAAESWCEKMSHAGYGRWQYLFVQQKRLDRALAAGLSTLSGLATHLVGRGQEEPLRIFPVDDEHARAEAFKTLLPIYSLQAAAGSFGRSESVDPEGWIRVEGLGRLDERMFVARAVGRSMEPLIHDGDYCVFRTFPVGSRQGKIVLVQYRGPDDPETGGAFTIKKYRSEKLPDPDTDWRHESITLEPLNPDFSPIVLNPRDEGDVRVIAEFVGILPRSSN